MFQPDRRFGASVAVFLALAALNACSRVPEEPQGRDDQSESLGSPSLAAASASVAAGTARAPVLPEIATASMVTSTIVLRGNGPVAFVDEVFDGGLLIAGWDDGSVCARRYGMVGLDRTSCAPADDTALTGAAAVWEHPTAALYARQDRTIGLLEVHPDLGDESIGLPLAPVPGSGTITALDTSRQHANVAVGTDAPELFFASYGNEDFRSVAIDAEISRWGRVRSLTWLGEQSSPDGIVVRFDGHAAVVNPWDATWTPLPGALDIAESSSGFAVLWPGRLEIIDSRGYLPFDEAIRDGKVELEAPSGVTRIATGEDGKAIYGLFDRREDQIGVWEVAIASRATRFVPIDLPAEPSATAWAGANMLIVGDVEGNVSQLQLPGWRP